MQKNLRRRIGELLIQWHYLAMVSPRNFSVISDVEFRHGVPVKPVPALYTQVMPAIKVIEEKGEEIEVYLDGRITLETGLKFCDNPSFFNVLIGR